MSRGAAFHHHKFTDADKRKMLTLWKSGLKLKIIALRFGVHQVTIRNMVREIETK